MKVTQVIFDKEHLKSMYQRVVERPNQNPPQSVFIRCPFCGEEILMIPTLRVMNEAIENHIRKHKEELEDNPIKQHQTAISVRLSLTIQVLRLACKPELP